MKKSKKLFAVLVMVSVFLIALCACGGPKTLETYLEKHPDEKAKIEDYAKNNNMEITVKDNTVTYLYKMTNDVSDEYMSVYKSAFESSFAKYKTQFTGIVKDLEEETKIKGIKFVVNVVDKSGKDIYSAEFTNE